MSTDAYKAQRDRYRKAIEQALAEFSSWSDGEDAVYLSDVDWDGHLHKAWRILAEALKEEDDG